jgi:ABC-2 type transport system ATP-binding protein
MNEPTAIRRRIACVPQESRPLYFMTVFQLIYWYLRMRGMDRADSKARTDAIIKELSLTDVAQRVVQRLSGGMRRRCMVAMVLATDAEVIYLDEPTTGLDPLARREVWGAIRRASLERRTVLLTTHYLDEAEELSARIALVEGGELRLEGTPAELRSRVRLPVRLALDKTLSHEEVQSFGRVTDIEDGLLVFARESDARELARLALERGAKVSMAPVSLEDIFLEIVGRPIESDAPLAAEESW